MSLISDDLKSNYLFLLLGANPLPPLVAASLLALSTDSHLVILATSEVAKVKDRLLTYLCDKGLLRQLVSIELTNPSDAATIERELTNYLTSLSLKPGQHIGLHYTGGTKPMALHTHALLGEWCREHQHQYVFSYLDPRDLCMRFANGRKVMIEPTQITLSLIQLLELHGWELKEPTQTPVLPELATFLATQLSNPKKLYDWRLWCTRHLRTWQGPRDGQAGVKAFLESEAGAPLREWVGQEPSGEEALHALAQWVQGDKLKESAGELATTPLHPLLSEWLEKEGTLTDLLERSEVPREWSGKEKYHKLARFLDGDWLENHVLAAVCRVAGRAQLNSFGINLKPKRTATSVHFEFDVAAMRGYRLFALSCTTDTTRKLNKSKLFEAYTRARQMGGDEARVALVGGEADTCSLLEEVNEEWMAPRDMIRVWGPQEWHNLEDELERWFVK